MGGILLIDAEQPFADQLAGSLSKRGFSVKLLDDGKDGLDYAQKSRPDLIVLCVELPKMSGYSICNKLKKDNDLKGIPLIITSKEATPETFAQHKKLKTRAEDYLIKPFSDAELVEKIGALIPLPSGGAVNGNGAQAAPPAVDDALDALESLGADLNLGPSAGGEESAVKIDDTDFAALDVDGGSSSSAGSGLGLSPEDDALLASLDDLGKSDPQPSSAGLDDLDLGGGTSNPAADFDAAFESIAEPSPPAAPAKPAPAPAPAPAPVATREPLPRTGSSTIPTTAAADLQQLSQLRRDNGDLKAKIAELEARLKAAEDSVRSKDAQIAAAATTAGAGAGSAREVLSLKEQLRAKEKEIGSLKDEVFEKEKANVDLQEQIDQVRNEMTSKIDEVLSKAQQKDVEISGLKAKVQALSEERDELEQQVQGRLQQAEHERDELRQQVEATKVDLGRAKNDLDKAKQAEERLKMDLDRSKVDADQERKAKAAAEQKAKDAEAKVRELESEVRKQEDRALKAYERMKQDEKVRDRAKQAAQLAYRLLNGEVEAGDGGSVDLDQLDAE